MNNKKATDKRVIIGIWALLFVVTSFIFYFDYEIMQGVSMIRNNSLYYFFGVIELIGSNIIVVVFLTGLFLSQKKKRKFVLPLWFTLAITAVTGFLIKIAVQRPRPFQLGLISASLDSINYSLWDFSFPSFHTMLVFCALPLISKEFPKIKIWWITFAVLVALSRIYLGLHFVSDVIIGGALGYLIGFFILSSIKKD